MDMKNSFFMTFIMYIGYSDQTVPYVWEFLVNSFFDKMSKLSSYQKL